MVVVVVMFFSQGAVVAKARIFDFNVLEAILGALYK